MKTGYSSQSNQKLILVLVSGTKAGIRKQFIQAKY